MDFFEWLELGVERGWVSRPECATHEGIPRTAEEEAQWEEGYDPCEVVMRVWYPETAPKS